ncbi:MAG: hypothetical protein KAJ55_04850, partial [Anaerolineales bacterium]|nr:hypothetical protein [Anaerolineales bacterium]
MGDYLVISNSSYNGVSSVNVTGVLLAELDVTANAGGPYSPSVGNVSITGTVNDNRSAVARSSSVWISVTAPDGTLTAYTTTSDSNGNYVSNFNTSTLTGTHNVKVTANDSVGVVGGTSTSFDVGLYTTLSNTTGSPINLDVVQELTLNITDSSVGGSPITGADVTINISRPDSSYDNYSTPVGITDNGDGTYTLNYTNTSITGNYTATSTAINNSYSSVSSIIFMIDEIDLTSQVGGPYIVGDTLTVTGSVESNRRAIAYDGNISVNVTDPGGTSVEYIGTRVVSATYSVEEISLPLSGNYTLNVSALDSTGIYGLAQPVNVPVRFLVSTQFDKVSYDSGDNVTAYIRAYNGTGYEPGVDVTSQIIYVSNGSVIDTNVTTT